jgi:membrane protease YdiL (CAAX protease family)
MKTGTASGWQIAFFSFTGVLLAVPLSRYLAGLAPWSKEEREFLGKALPFFVIALILGVFPALRSWYRRELSIPIPRERRKEVAIVALGKVMFFAMAIAGSVALWHWLFGGTAALERRMSMQLSDEAQRSGAVTPLATLQFLVLVPFVVPILEELVFRGLLYRAWEKRWGWFPAMIATSVVFALYHPFFLSAFLASIVYVCLLRRTGTLWAPIIVHGLYNLSLWHPLMGHLLFPKGRDAHTDIAAWDLQIGCLFVVAIALPIYVWMAREKYEPRGTSAR